MVGCERKETKPKTMVGRVGIFASSVASVPFPDIWFDAQDLSTVPAGVTNGSIVSTWQSKGLVPNFSLARTDGTATYRTNWVGNGKSALQFDGYRGAFSDGAVTGNLGNAEAKRPDGGTEPGCRHGDHAGQQFPRRCSAVHPDMYIVLVPVQVGLLLLRFGAGCETASPASNWFNSGNYQFYERLGGKIAVNRYTEADIPVHWVWLQWLRDPAGGPGTVRRARERWLSCVYQRSQHGVENGGCGPRVAHVHGHGREQCGLVSLRSRRLSDPHWRQTLPVGDDVCGAAHWPTANSLVCFVN